MSRQGAARQETKKKGEGLGTRKKRREPEAKKDPMAEEKQVRRYRSTLPKTNRKKKTHPAQNQPEPLPDDSAEIKIGQL